MKRYFLCLLLMLAGPVHAISPEQVGVIVNDNDLASIEIGKYYRDKRGIPARNIVHVNVDPKKNALPLEDFRTIRIKVETAMPPGVQFLAIAWTMPSMVGECESITSAMARGLLGSSCGFDRPSVTADSPYFRSTSAAPFADFGMRPAMMLAGKSVADVKAMIDRGVASDGTQPKGKAYIMLTSDRNRNVRARRYAGTGGKTGRAYGPKIDIELRQAETISGTTDTMFYFQGIEKLGDVTATNRFPPGAYVDNLSSFSGRVGGNRDVLDAVKGAGGATAYAGSVSEPFALYFKFPDPDVMIPCYVGGGSMIECAWKSLRQTAQILFIGEPMASPYAIWPGRAAAKAPAGRPAKK